MSGASLPLGQVRPSEVEAAACRPMVSPGRFFWPLAGLLGAIVLAAFLAFGYQFLRGLWVAGYSDRAFYGIYEANLVAFIGVSYGGALVSAVLRLSGAHWRAPITRIAEAMALVSLLVGASFAIVHLGRPERVLLLITSGNASSPILWDFVAITSYLLATLMFVYLPLVPDLARVRDRLRLGSWRRRIYGFAAISWDGSPKQRRWLEWGLGGIAILIIPLAVSVHSVLAWTFSMTTRPGWHSTIFGPYFVVGALYSGVALVIVVVACFRRAYRLERFIEPRHLILLGWIMAVLGLTYLYLTFSELLTAGYARTREEVSVVAVLLEGRFAPAFWAFMVFGLLVPIALVALPTRRRVGALLVAALLAVVGMWLKRLLIVLPTATLPLVDDVWGSIRITLVPALITLGATAAIPLGLIVVFRFVPVLAIDEVEHEVARQAGAARESGR